MTIEQRVIATIAEQLGMEQSYVASQPKPDWGMDSLDEIEVVMALEDEFGIVIEDDDAEKWRTAQDVVSYVESKASA